MVDLKLKKEEQKELLQIARRTLEVYLQNRMVFEPVITNPALNQKLGAFVTLRTKDDHLRGCIGQFEPGIPLWQVVQRQAIEAATGDPRFLPVFFAELKGIVIEISVLSPRLKVKSWQEIELGKHGVVVKKGSRSGVFLPQVATETGWNLETFMAQLCSQKAGLPWDYWKNPAAELYIFTAQVFEEK